MDEVRHWERYDSRGEPWFGFECVRDLKGVPPEVLLVPLVGHTWGHSGIAVQLSDGWLLHAGATRRSSPAGRRRQRIDRRNRTFVNAIRHDFA